MPIDASREVKADFLRKWIVAKDLMAILDALPPDAELFPNIVGNLSVFFDGAYRGFIDVAVGEFSPLS